MLECDRCKGRYTRELAFNEHKCVGRNLEDLTDELLRALAFGEITEDEAWRRFDEM